MQRLTHADDVGLTALTPFLHSPLPHNITSHMQRLTHADDVGPTALTPSLHLLTPTPQQHLTHAAPHTC